MKKQTMLIIALIVSTPAWIYLFTNNWKIALAIMVVMFGNNLTNKANNN